MKLLLITTGSNHVEQTVRQLLGTDCRVIDCADAQACSHGVVKAFVERAVSRHYQTEGTPDLLLVYRCPCIIPQRLFERPRLGAFNLHPSLLPKHPGLNPWSDIFAAHERTTGVTLHRMTAKADSGPIVSQAAFAIDASDTVSTARLKSDREAAALVRRFLLGLLSDLSGKGFFTPFSV